MYLTAVAVDFKTLCFLLTQQMIKHHLFDAVESGFIFVVE